MIAKPVTGNDFFGALEYGAGLRSDRTNKQAELLSVANLGTKSRSTSTRIRNMPVVFRAVYAIMLVQVCPNMSVFEH